MLRFSDARNFGRTATGLLLIVGPLLLIVGGIVGPDTGDGNSVKDKLHELAVVQSHKGSFLLGNIIFMVAGLCLGFGFATRRPFGFAFGLFLLEAIRVSGGWRACKATSPGASGSVGCSLLTWSLRS